MQNTSKETTVQKCKYEHIMYVINPRPVEVPLNQSFSPRTIVRGQELKQVLMT